jgi:hypothetical protein
VVVVPAEIFCLLLAARLPICLIEETVIGFFLYQDGVLVDADTIDFASGEFHKTPPAIFIGHLMFVDYEKKHKSKLEHLIYFGPYEIIIMIMYLSMQNHHFL